MESLKLFNEYLETAEKNLSYKNESADATALKYYQLALELDPGNIAVKQKINILDKVINYKNYNYAINDEQTLKLIKIFVNCCNVREFDRMYQIIADDFVCICLELGRTKKSFIDNIYFARKSIMGLRTELLKYESDGRIIPCVKLNDKGVIFFNIENDKIIRAFYYKIDDNLIRNKLTKTHDL